MILGSRTGIWVIPHVTCRRVIGLGASWEAFARHDVGVVIVTHQDLHGRTEVVSKVLRLAIRTHDLIPADTIVVLRRDTTRVVKGLLTSQDHRPF